MYDEPCFFCGTKTNVAQSDFIQGYGTFTFVKCPVCGRYEYSERFKKSEYKDMVAAYLYHHDKSEAGNNPLFYYFLGTEDEYKNRMQLPGTYAYHTTIEDVKAFYPRTFSQKIDCSLLALAQKSGFFGKIIEVSDDEIQSLFFINRFDENGYSLPAGDIKNQYVDILNYLSEIKYIQYQGRPNSTKIELMPDGWKAIEHLQISDKYNKSVFIAMSFNEVLKPIRNAIKMGTLAAGFSPVIMDETIHNKLIVPEMLRMIREARFLIMDISEPNYGAYYEAGYALGLGKEVIITCSEKTYKKEYTTEEEKKYEKYMKPHFDIAQKQILVWESFEDLSCKLEQWIRALFT